MMRFVLLPLLAVAAAGAARPVGPIAFRLADQPLIASPSAWRAPPVERAWDAVAGAKPTARQQARWRYALALVVAGRSADALAVLDVMKSDEPDLALVDNYQLARGRVLVELGRTGEAVAALDRPALQFAPEACAWRMRALAPTLPSLAVRQLRCARTAINARSNVDRSPFLVAVAQAAIEVGDPQAALRWLSFLGQEDPQANVARGHAHLALGQAALAESAFSAVPHEGIPGAAAREGLIEARVMGRRIPPAAAIRQLAAFGYGWRGDEIEERSLWLRWNLARVEDAAEGLAAAATLVRYFQPGSRLPALMDGVRAILFATLGTRSATPLARAAGLYWDYRDLAPVGADGDALVALLADRLQSAGLYARAAALLEHQLFDRARDVAQGPLSVRVAKLQILAGAPDRALDALRETGQTIYPAAMVGDRSRIEAVALHQLGRDNEALALLEDVSGASALRSEILWRSRDWERYADQQRSGLPSPGALSELHQALVLRQAIALAMLGREPQLSQLRARYAKDFARLASARAFDLLTAPRGTADSSQISSAMAAMPSASPAGELADLMDAAPPTGAGQRR